MSLGIYIKEKRTERHLSQRKLAAACGLSGAEICRIENGERKQPSPKVIRQLADALCVPVTELFAAAGVMESGASGDSAASFEFDEKSYINVSDLTDAEVEDVKKYIEFVKSRRSM